MDLPRNVHAVVTKGRTYYYHQAGRNTEAAGPRTSLGRDAQHPDFWARIRELNGDAVEAGTVAAMALAYRGTPRKTKAGLVFDGASPDFAAHSAATQRDYSFYIDKFLVMWRDLKVSALRPVHVLAARDILGKTSPGSANHMLAVGKTFFAWGVPREYTTTNPFREVGTIEIEDDGHWPWPDWALAAIAAEAWPDLARLVFLGVATGQRESDLVRLGPAAMEGPGIWIRPRKTRKRKKAFWVPLTGDAVARIDDWCRSPMTFASVGRHARPREVAPGTTFLLSTAGRPYTPEGLRSRWNRWLREPAGVQFLARWTQWERARRERDGEDVPAAAVLRPTLHGLRSTAVVHRRLAGYSDEQVANDIGMSLAMVRRYSRFIDQKHAAETNIVTLERAKKRGMA